MNYCSNHEESKTAETSKGPTLDSVSIAISEKYHSHFGANIQCQYRELIVVTDTDHKELLSAVGYRKPDSDFFLENYLNRSAECYMSEIYKEEISREHLVEIGNFIGNNGKAAYTLMHKLSGHLAKEGYQHLLLTCTRQLKRTFQGLPFHVLAKANREDVPKGDHWGSYYQQKPEVITGRLSDYDRRYSKYSSSKAFVCHHINQYGETHVI